MHGIQNNMNKMAIPPQITPEQTAAMNKKPRVDQSQFEVIAQMTEAKKMENARPKDRFSPLSEKDQREGRANDQEEQNRRSPSDSPEETPSKSSKKTRIDIRV